MLCVNSWCLVRMRRPRRQLSMFAVLQRRENPVCGGDSFINREVLVGENHDPQSLLWNEGNVGAKAVRRAGFVDPDIVLWFLRWLYFGNRRCAKDHRRRV